MCEEELVVLYNRDHLYYCNRQQFGLGSEDAKKAHKIIQTLEKDGNKIIDIAMLTSEEINGLLEDIDQEIDFCGGISRQLEDIKQDINFYGNVQNKTSKSMSQTNLKHLSSLQKARNEITELLSRRRKM